MKALMLVLACAIAVVAQKQPVKPCPLTLEQSPEVRGLKLGQSYESRPRLASEDLVQLRDTADETGVISADVSNYSGRSERFKGIRDVDLYYLDNVLASFTINYNRDVKWQSDAHFTAAIADALHLPVAGWAQELVFFKLECDGFFVRTGMASNGGMLHIESSGYSDEVASRKAAIEQKKRVQFKP